MKHELKITKQLVQKLEAAPIEVKIWNGWFRKAVVKVKWYRSELQLSVNVGHPLIASLMHCDWKDTANMVYWKEGMVREIPEELHGLAQRMKEAATIQDNVAMKEHQELKKVLYESYKEMGFI